MNTSHINHSTDLTIPKQLKSVNPNYVTAHFGKWGMGSNPSVLGYDESDGATGNKDGVFTQKPQGVQWENTIDEDPKKMFSITKKLLILSIGKLNQIIRFFYNFLIMPFILIFE